MDREILAKGYEPKDVEQKWYEYWEEKKLFRAQAPSDKDPYCIVIPPPNVTGTLHMGHALNNTLQDILCLLYTSPSPRDRQRSRMPSSA